MAKMIEDIVFIICCKESDFIENCINHLDNNYPNNYKIIIDSDSTDKSYMNKIKKDKVIIEDIKNKNYEAGAFFLGFIKYKNFGENFVFMQDSLCITDKILEFESVKENEVFVFEENETGWTIDPPAKKEFFNQNKNFIPSIKKEKFLLAIWNCFIIKKETFQKVIDSNMFNTVLLPNNKSTSRAFERIWSNIFHQNNINMKVIQKKNYIKSFGKRQ